MKFLFFIINVVFFYGLNCKYLICQPNSNPNILKVNKTEDFSINGKGTSVNWSKTEWIKIPARNTSSENFTTKMKLLYSNRGIYFLFECEDDVLTATMQSDFMKLWKEDVIEVFLRPDVESATYFEYELSPLNYELPILVSNVRGELSRWIPYIYKGDRKTSHQTSVSGGNKRSGELITNWKAEFFIPFKLLRPLNNIEPTSGTRWKANFYRVDYDHGKQTYQWSPIETNFHDIKNFGTIFFE